MKLFHQHGYSATGIAAILKEADVLAGSLYYFFPSKEALLLGVLDRYVELMDAVVMQPAFATTSDPIERIFAVLKQYRDWIEVSAFNATCPIGSLALELDPDMAEARSKIAQNFANWCRAIEACLDAAADRLPRNVDRHALSRFVLTVMEGGMMQARAHREIEPFDVGVAQLRDYFNRLMAECHPTK